MKTHSIFLLVAALIQLPFSKSFAGDPLNTCGSSKTEESTWKDLRQPGQSMHGIPVLDQDGQGFCYAYSGTVQAAAWLNLHASPSLSKEEREALVLSPFAQATAAAMSENHSCNHPCEVANSVFDGGACSSNSVVFSGGGGIRPLDRPDVVMEKCIRWENTGTIKQQLRNIDQLLATYTRLPQTSANFQHMADALEKTFAHKDFHKMNEQERMEMIRYTLSNQGPIGRSYLALMAPRCFKSSGDGKDFGFTGNVDLKKVLDAQTDEELKKKIPVCSFVNGAAYDCKVKIPTAYYTPEQYVQGINAIFDQEKPMPVGVDYCWTFLMDGPHTPSETQLNQCKSADGQSRGDHKSVLIGRRLNPTTQKCEFLLRNSWGNDCNSYYGGDKADPNGNYFQSCQSELKNHGAADIWVEASVLARNLHGMENLKEKDGGK